MRAVAWIGPGRLEHTEVPEPVPDEGQALVEVAACGVCGSDLHAYAHGYAVRPGQVLGHEFAGRVLAAPGVAGLAEGDRVTARPIVPCGSCAPCRSGAVQFCTSPADTIIGFGVPGAFAERVLVPVAVTGATVFPLPATVDDRAGALTEPLAVALHAVRLAGPVAGATALVLGAGAIGLGVVQFLALGGAATIVVADPSVLRREAALTIGAHVALDPLADDIVASVRERTGGWLRERGARADVVVDCAGAPGTFTTALDAARQGGTVVLAAMGATRADFRPDVIAAKELVVRGSLAYRDEFGEVIARLGDGSIDADAFISHTFALDDIADAFETQRDAGTSLKVLVRP